jgi:hypothetical protein
MTKHVVVSVALLCCCCLLSSPSLDELLCFNQFCLFLFVRLKSGKPFGSRESVKPGGSQWGSSDPLDQPNSTTSSAMGAMNGNPSMRSSTGAGNTTNSKQITFSLFSFLLFSKEEFAQLV